MPSAPKEPTGAPTTPEVSHGPSPPSEPVSIRDVYQRLSLVSERIVQVVLPVTICALYCCMLIRMLTMNLSPTQANLLDSTWRQLGIQVTGDVVVADSTISTNVASYIIVVAIFCILIVLVTLLILFIFYMEWQQCLIYYFYLPSVVILALVTPAFLRTILHSFNLFAIDIFTIILLTWNFTSLGMMSIFALYAPTPLCLQQSYLIHNSAMISVLIIHALPGWAPWLLLAFLVLWDLFAVLAPYGPLNLILDMADKGGIVEMPGLIYSTDTLPVIDDNDEEPVRERQKGRSSLRKKKDAKPDTDKQATDIFNDTHGKTIDALTIKSDDNGGNGTKKTPTSLVESTRVGEGGSGQSTSPHQRAPSNTATTEAKDQARVSPTRYDVLSPIQNQSIVEKGVNIGLGDFIFYSLLIGLTSKGRDQNDFYTVVTTLNSVQFGLVLTLLILALTKRALPALPISIGLGLSVAALTIQFVPQLSNSLASASIFV